MKTGKISAGSIFWGLLLIGTAVVLILEGIGVGDIYGVSVPGIALGILLITWLVYLIVKKKYYLVFLPIGLFYTFVVDKPLAKALNVDPASLKADGRMIQWWIVLIASVLLCIAFKVLFSKKNVIDTETVRQGGKLGNSTLYFDAADLAKTAVISDNLGATTVYITNKEAYQNDGVIKICNNVGNITLHIPGVWLVVSEASENIGQVFIPKQTWQTEKTITLVVTENVGRITVVFEY